MRQKVQDYRYLFLLSTMIGIICHGFMIFNKFSLNDDNDCLFRLGITFEQGRWAIGLLDIFAQKLNTFNFSLPVFNGVLMVICISLAICVLCEIFEIKDKISRILVAGIMIVFPEIASTLGFMFQAWTWGMALLLIVIADYLILKTNTLKSIVAGLLICVSLGLYQGFLATGICICNLYFCFRHSSSIKEDVVALLKTILFFVLGVIEYLLANSLFLKLIHTQMTSYQNMDTWGIVSAKEYIERIKQAANVFFKGDIAYVEVAHKLYPVCIIAFGLVGLVWLIRLFNNKKSIAVWKTFILMCLPFTFSFHYIISGAIVHPEMLYSSCFVLISLLIFVEKTKIATYDAVDLKTKNNIKVPKCWSVLISLSRCVSYIIVFTMFIVFFRYDNILYLKAYAEHEEDVAFLNRLATRIQSVEGYNDDYPVLLYNVEQINDNSFFRHPQLSRYDYLPYKDQVNNMDIYWYLNNWVGYGPQMATESDSERIVDSSEFVEMPIYPDDGSIKIIDGIIVVKCTE